MEFISRKQVKSHKRKKKSKSKRRGIKKLEVKPMNCQNMAKNNNINHSDNAMYSSPTMMPGETFWENYQNSLNWQQR